MTSNPLPTDPPSAPARTRWGMVLAVWTVPALIGALESHRMAAEGDGGASGGGTWATVLATLLLWYLWALATPAIFALARRLPVRRPHRIRAVFVHLAAGTANATAMVALIVLVEWGLEGREALEAGSYPAQVGTFLARNLPGFLMLYGVVAAIGMALELRRRNAQLERHLVESRLQALTAQLQPHFLFNTLHAISSLIDEDPAAARKMVARLSELLRATLATDGHAEVPLEKEIECLERYLDIERVRLGERLRLEYAVDGEALEARVPSLLLQPLVENAVRYAVAPKAQGGTIRIGARLDGSRLELEVADDGPGLHGDDREGIGLANTRARLAELYGSEGRLDLQNGAGQGATVRVTLPAVAREPRPERT